jgi:hypothetical protein
MTHLAFRRRGGVLYSYLIRILTLSPYSHVDLIFSDGATFTAEGHFRRVMLYHKAHDPEHWDVFPLLLTEGQERRARKLAESLKDEPFGMLEMYSFLLPFLPWRKNYWICSSAIMYVLQRGARVFRGGSHKISPKGVFKLLRKEYFA